MKNALYLLNILLVFLLHFIQKMSARFQTCICLPVCSSSVSPQAFYLSGDLAFLEQAILYQTCQMLMEAGLEQFSCPDMVKTVILVRIK